MAAGKEIRSKIRSVQNTQKITRAMEMVAASKMRKAQERMKAIRPWGEKIRSIVAHLSHANRDFEHPYLQARSNVKRVGIILVSTDKGLCGGLNTNVFRLTAQKLKSWNDAGIEMVATSIGSKGNGFLQRSQIKTVSHVHALGDAPQIQSLVGCVKVMTDAFIRGEVDEIHLVYTRFVNTMKQEAVCEKLLPLAHEGQEPLPYSWDYLYEPSADAIVHELFQRYIEGLVYQAVVENISSEQSARMVAMKAASDNAGSVIDDLKLVYNKSRQAAITKELAEIVSGAAAV